MARPPARNGWNGAGSVRITVYDFGTITVDGKTHTRDVIIYPERVQGNWWRNEGHRLSIEDLAEVWESKPDTVVIGTGYYGNMVIPEETREYARARGIEIIDARTPQAVGTFNELQSDPTKTVVSALHLTC